MLRNRSSTCVGETKGGVSTPRGSQSRSTLRNTRRTPAGSAVMAWLTKTIYGMLRSHLFCTSPFAVHDARRKSVETSGVAAVGQRRQ